MPKITLNPALIRVVVIALFLIISQFLRAMKMSKNAKPASESATAKGPQLGEILRDTVRRAGEQSRTRQGEFPDGQPPSAGAQFQPPEFQQTLFQQPEFQQPPSTEPESSFIPSLLLLALLGCLCLMAYRHWAG